MYKTYYFLYATKKYSLKLREIEEKPSARVGEPLSWALQECLWKVERGVQRPLRPSEGQAEAQDPQVEARHWVTGAHRVRSMNTEVGNGALASLHRERVGKRGTAEGREEA